jgi:hypothetical protein
VQNPGRLTAKKYPPDADYIDTITSRFEEMGAVLAVGAEFRQQRKGEVCMSQSDGKAAGKSQRDEASAATAVQHTIILEVNAAYNRENLPMPKPNGPNGRRVLNLEMLLHHSFYWVENERRFAAGLVLSLCLFKPTLVALPAAMLLVSRRWRAVAGLAAGGAALALASFFTVGLEGLRAWTGMLALAAQVSARPEDAWHRAKYVDMSAFFRLLLGNSQPLTSIVLIVLGLAAVSLLGRAWWQSNHFAENELWAATLCFILVVNAYAPIYDMVLVVAAVAFVAASTRWNERTKQDREAFAIWLLLLYMLPWVTQAFAEFLHFQVITLVLAGFGVWTLRLVSTSDAPVWIQPNPEQEESTIPHGLQPRVAGRL